MDDYTQGAAGAVIGATLADLVARLIPAQVPSRQAIASLAVGLGGSWLSCYLGQEKAASGIAVGAAARALLAPPGGLSPFSAGFVPIQGGGGGPVVYSPQDVGAYYPPPTSYPYGFPYGALKAGFPPQVAHQFPRVLVS